MDEPASKRRRVSPRNSLAGETSKNDATPRTLEELRRKRPSYASPTTASISRSHQETTERRRSLPPSKPTSSHPNTIKNAPNRALDIRPAPTAVDAAASDLSQDAEEGEEDQTAIQDSDMPGPMQSSLQVGGGLAAAPRKSPAKPNPRPLPPPAPDGDDEFNPFVGRSLRRSPVTGVSVSRPEPELPPAVSDPVSSTPPRGIHSSPSRWREKGKHKKSSPLKPISKRLFGENGKYGPMHAAASQSQTSTEESQTQGPLLDTSANPARKVSAFDPNGNKKDEREALREEIAKLKKDIRIANEENERIRVMQSSGRIISSSDEDAVLDVIQRYTLLSDDDGLPAQSQLLVKVALNPMGLLPFSKPISLPSISDKQDSVSDIKSHHPVKMSAEDELPYLQLFNPFTVTSTVTVLPTVPDEPLRQRRIITFQSRDEPGLFTSKVEMVVNALNLGILDLKVPSLEPAAKAELGPFLNTICAGDCNRSMQRNIGILSWAMGEWYRASVQRAGLWTQLDRELSPKGGVFKTVKELRKRKPRHRRDEESEESEEPKAVSCTKPDLLRFMGQQSFELRIPSIDEPASTSTFVLLKWTIEFDWTGEAQNKVAVMIGIPGKWRHMDQRGDFGKLPGLFEHLVEDGEEPVAAVSKIVSLLVGDQVESHTMSDE